MQIDRQKLILVTSKYTAYLINIAIIAVIAGGVGFYLYSLMRIVIN